MELQGVQSVFSLRKLLSGGLTATSAMLFRELPTAVSVGMAVTARRCAWTVIASQVIASQAMCPAVTPMGVERLM